MVGTTEAQDIAIETVSEPTLTIVNGESFFLPAKVALVTDQCTNREGIQSEVPEGMVRFEKKCGIPDMGFSYFRKWRIYQKGATHNAKVNRCRGHERAHFELYTKEIAPWNRRKNLDGWRGRKERAR